MDEEEKVNFDDIEIVEDECSEVELYFPGKKPISFLRCRTCYLNKECLYVDVNSEKCLLQEIETIDTTTGSGIISLVQTMLAIQAQRVLRFVKIEEMERGIPDPVVTQELLVFVSLVEKLKKILSEDDMFIIKGKGKGAVGVLEKLFGDLGKE